jgi:DNA polymerase III alpha subunit (gram-positive type)
MLDTNYNYCFIDFETTGLSHERDDIIQVGCIITDAELQIISHFSSFINPGYDIDKLKTIVSYTTGISPEQIMNGISLQEFVASIKKIFAYSDKPLVFIGQNIQFDIKFLKKYLGKHELQHMNYE